MVLHPGTLCFVNKDTAVAACSGSSKEVTNYKVCKLFRHVGNLHRHHRLPAPRESEDGPGRFSFSPVRFDSTPRKQNIRGFHSLCAENSLKTRNCKRKSLAVFAYKTIRVGGRGLGVWGLYMACPGMAGCREARDVTGREPALLTFYAKEDQFIKCV